MNDFAEVYDKGFSEMPMWDQLAKIVDSAGNPKERDWVKTDDGDTITGISPAQATMMLESIANIKPLQRLEIIKMIQTTAGFNKVKGIIVK